MKAWENVRDFLPMVAVLLLCMFVMPATQAYASNGSNNGTSAATVQPSQQVQPAAAEKAPAQPAKKATATKPREKSVLDADVLESPIDYFRDAFSSKEEETDNAAGANAVVVTLKALVATLLSTVI